MVRRVPRGNVVDQVAGVNRAARKRRVLNKFTPPPDVVPVQSLVVKARKASDADIRNLMIQAELASKLKEVAQDLEFAEDAVSLLRSLSKTSDDITDTVELDVSLLQMLPDSATSLRKQNPTAGARALKSTPQETQAARDLLPSNEDFLKKLPRGALDLDSTKLKELDDTFDALLRTRGEQLDTAMRRANGEFTKASDARRAVARKINTLNTRFVDVNTIDSKAMESMQASLDNIRRRVGDMRLRSSKSDMFRVADMDDVIDDKKLQFWDDFDVLPPAYRGTAVDPPPTMRKIIEAAGESTSSPADLLDGIRARLKKIDDFRANRPPGISATPQLRRAQQGILTDASFLDNLPADSELRVLARKTSDEISALGDKYWDDVSRLLEKNTSSMSPAQLERLEVANLQVRLVSSAPATKPSGGGFQSWSDTLVGDDALVPLSVGGQELTGHITQLTKDIDRIGNLDALDNMLRSKYKDLETTRASLLQANNRSLSTAADMDDEVNKVFADMQEWTKTFPGRPGDPIYSAWQETLEGATTLDKKRQAIAAFNEQATLITKPKTMETVDKIKQKLRKTGKAHKRYEPELRKIADLLDDGYIDKAIEKFEKTLTDIDKGPTKKLTRAQVKKANMSKRARQKTGRKRVGVKPKRDPRVAEAARDRVKHLQETRREIEKVLGPAKSLVNEDVLVLQAKARMRRAKELMAFTGLGAGFATLGIVTVSAAIPE